ncbi:sulfotransferase family protein [Ruegeria sp. 2205SS24-7]|uniref:sulfotransferase family protein n=1 Tax=Ruegeria discodermiae TaxID=3064389 RepID=UPI0027414D49|nr:sulfotransferase family protein [Ruegeria sp. 2205SS24-7]MDP5220748.1 sulfotransferase family protein [Ruegeria sp. 2205SS24-7]
MADKTLFKRQKKNKTLYLHIGHFKTGTTALQLFLEKNRSFLALNDAEYAEFKRVHCKHSVLAFSIYKAAGVGQLMHGYAKPETPQELWSGLFDYVRSSRRSKVLVSSEEFMRMGAHPKAIDILSEVAAMGSDIDIRIIAYLRQPQAHLQSWYNQLVKMGEPVLDFDETVYGIMEEVHFDYGLALKPWIDVFGPEAVTVRPYVEGSKDSKALYADFLSALGISLPDTGVHYPKQDPNPRLSAEKMALAQMIRGANLPKPVAEWTQKRASKLLDTQDSLHIRPPITQQDIATRAEAGLQLLRSLPGNAVDVGSFWNGLTLDEDPALKEARQLTKFLLMEIHALRQRLNKTEISFEQRIEALENRLKQDLKK